MRIGNREVCLGRTFQGNSWASGLSILGLFINHSCCRLALETFEWGRRERHSSVLCQEIPDHFVLSRLLCLWCLPDLNLITVGLWCIKMWKEFCTDISPGRIRVRLALWWRKSCWRRRLLSLSKHFFFCSNKEVIFLTVSAVQYWKAKHPYLTLFHVLDLFCFWLYF